ncbi:hypothetical protein YC2023_048394 [Brassica napus]
MLVSQPLLPTLPVPWQSVHRLVGTSRLWGKTTNWVGFRVSVVWEGRHLVDGTVVAIKEIAMSEIFILRKINHPNIIHFIDMIEVRIGDGRDGEPAMILQPALARSRQISLPLPEESLVRRTTLSLSSHHGSSCFNT